MEPTKEMRLMAQATKQAEARTEADTKETDTTTTVSMTKRKVGIIESRTSEEIITREMIIISKNLSTSRILSKKISSPGASNL